MTYRVKLEVFEGPLDLLLYLIKKENINIYDIPIATITDQYLHYLELMTLLDLNIAGEFLVMAATLMHIKSKLLLPKAPDEQGELDEEDPRAELVRKLLEYQKFKEAAVYLAEREHQQKEVFKRLPVEMKSDGDEGYFEANLFDLITAFTRILKEVPKKAFYEVIKDEYTVAEKIHDIYHTLVEHSVLYFTELFKSAKGKIEVVTIFLALLELVRLREVVIYQDAHFGEIKIMRNEQNIHPASPSAKGTEHGDE